MMSRLNQGNDEWNDNRLHGKHLIIYYNLYAAMFLIMHTFLGLCSCPLVYKNMVRARVHLLCCLNC